jgi:hypothetical protein
MRPWDHNAGDAYYKQEAKAASERLMKQLAQRFE